MLCTRLLSCSLLLSALQPLLPHPITHSDLMSYTAPVSLEEEQLVSPDEVSYSEQTFLSQNYPPLLTGDINREGLRTVNFVPSQAVKEVLLEKPLVNPLSHFRKQYRKRGSNTECFWKYCV